MECCSCSGRCGYSMRFRTKKYADSCTLIDLILLFNQNAKSKNNNHNSPRSTLKLGIAQKSERIIVVKTNTHLKS